MTVISWMRLLWMIQHSMRKGLLHTSALPCHHSWHMVTLNIYSVSRMA